MHEFGVSLFGTRCEISSGRRRIDPSPLLPSCVLPFSVPAGDKVVQVQYFCNSSISNNFTARQTRIIPHNMLDACMKRCTTQWNCYRIFSLRNPQNLKKATWSGPRPYQGCLPSAGWDLWYYVLHFEVSIYSRYEQRTFQLCNYWDMMFQQFSDLSQ